jgi:hypothetical protein
MTCLSHEQIVDYLHGEGDADAVEAHYFGCAACARAIDEVRALGAGLAAIIPPVVSRARLRQLEGSGLRVRETPVAPGAAVDVYFTRDVDLLVHALGANVAGAERVDFEIVQGDRVLIGFPAVPADAGEVLVACQRHYEGEVPDDARFRVFAVRAGTRVLVGEYRIRHHWL